MLHSILLAFGQSEQLAALIRSSRELRSLTAVLELTTPEEAGTSRIRIDYEAPGRARTERSSATGDTLTTWCVDGRLAVRIKKADQLLHGQVDSAELFAKLAPTEQALHDAFPSAPARGAAESAIGMDWAFDSKTQAPSFSLESQLRQPSASPLGWLETLRERRALAREDGELLRFETDGRFDVSVSKRHGFLQEFSCPSAKGKLQIALVSLDLNAAGDPARFAVPPPAAGARDISADLSRGVLRAEELDLRRRIYEAIAGEPATPAWEAAALAKITSVLRAFHERVVVETLAAWFERNRKVQDGVAERLAGLRRAGKSAQEVEQARLREIGYLNKQLDELEQGFLTRLAVPLSSSPLPRAAELLRQEQRVVSEVFRVLVREPVLSGFEKAAKQ